MGWNNLPFKDESQLVDVFPELSLVNLNKKEPHNLEPEISNVTDIPDKNASNKTDTNLTSTYRTDDTKQNSSSYLQPIYM